MAVSDVRFKSQVFDEIKLQCLQERQLFVDPEFTTDIALGFGDIVDSEAGNICNQDDEDKKDDTSKNEENKVSSLSVRRIQRSLPLSLRTELTPLQSDAPIPRTPPPTYTPLPPKTTPAPATQVPPPPPTENSPSTSSSRPRPPLPSYQSTEGDIIEWRRARDLHPNPRFLPDGGSVQDCVLGRMTDCGVAAGVAALAKDKELFDKVVPSDQSFEQGSYAGVFHFRLWHHGQWTDVVVDDFLPVVGGKPVYLHNLDESVFWAPLLEKAYAKLTGCYSDLEMFPPVSAMVDMTEGVATNYDLLVEDCVPDDLFWKLRKKLTDPDQNTLACLSVWKKPASEDTFVPHICSYTLLDLVEVYVDGQEWPVRLAKLRNPHGVEREWKDSEEDWKKVSGKERARIKLDFLEDGEFFMPWQHVVTRMYKLSVVDIEEDRASSQASACSGGWEKNKTAGGANSKRDSYGANPQFKLFLPEVDTDAFMASCVISLMQHGAREGDIAIGFSIYRCPMDVKGRLNIGRLRASTPVRVLKCEHDRDVKTEIVVEPGYYIIVPFTFETNQINKFTIRALSEKKSELEVLEDAKEEDFKLCDDPNDMEKPTRRHQVVDLETRSRRHAGQSLSVQGWGGRKAQNKNETPEQRLRRIRRELLRRGGRSDDSEYEDEQTSESSSDTSSDSE
eukprot:GFUD01036680.1.p1 GENE.GFUD01036680.1~~GFUD01036680.1.p1  ORF type:complete len:674 (-),score=191.30 GFUD01036680.1:1011-3032(-)